MSSIDYEDRADLARIAYQQACRSYGTARISVVYWVIAAAVLAYMFWPYGLGFVASVLLAAWRAWSKRRDRIAALGVYMRAVAALSHAENERRAAAVVQGVFKANGAWEPSPKDAA